MALRLAFPLALLVVMALHLVMIVQVEREYPMFGPEPFTWIDFDTHVEQTYRVTDALAHFGKTWGYDVQLLAGYPSGTVFDADNKGWELWTYGLWRAGLPRGTAFNLFVLAAHLLVPGVIYLSARLFRLERWEALLASFLAIMLWFFDGMARWSWYSGGVSFAIVSYLFVLPVALFYRFTETKRLVLLLPTAAVMAIGHLVHPSIFVLLVAPMTALYVRSFRKLSATHHTAVVFTALVVIAVNSWWLIIAFRFSHYVTDHEPFFIAGLSNLLSDYLQLIQDLTTTGLIGNRTAFRFLALAAGIIMLVVWKRRGDRRFLPLAIGFGLLVAVAYVGGYLWVFRQIQPYRNVVAAAMLATIPAAALVGELVRGDALRRLPRLTYATLGLCALLAVPHLLSDALYFFPRLIPTPPTLPTGETMPMSAFGYPHHEDYRHYPPPHGIDEVADWVKEHDDGHGRILVEWWVLGEYLAGRTGAQVLGGFRERNLEHRAANIFRMYPEGVVPEEELRTYLERYSVRWVIMTQELAELEASSFLERVAEIVPHRIYRSRLAVSYFQENDGKVRPALNRIEVEETRPEHDVVLRFHWLETLVCEPGCRIVREPIPQNKVGFIRIPAPHPSNFAVVNGY